MKPSRRNLENLANERAKLAQGKPLVSKYDRKRMTEEDYQILLSRHREINRGGVVAK